MVCMQPWTDHNGNMLYPCGNCLACKKQRTGEWAIRLTHEAMYWPSPLFLTLTYNEENLPSSGSLVPKDLILFLKRVNAKLKYKQRGFKYFSTGEYGDEYLRPHYHVIAFGLEMDDFVPVEGLRVKKYSLPQWTNGFIDVKPFTFARARYVAKYVQKSALDVNNKRGMFIDPRIHWPSANDLSVEQINSLAELYGVFPPFRRSSQGLGLRWAEENKEKICATAVIRINGFDHSVPRYYIKKLDLELSPQVRQQQEEQREREFKAEIAKRKIKPDEQDLYLLQKKAQRRKNAEKRIEIGNLQSKRTEF